MMRRRLATAIVGAAMCLHSGTAVAQSGGTPPSSVLLNGRDLALLGIATASSVALVTLDTRIANFMTDSGFQARHPGFKTAAYRASHVTETVLILTGGAVWGMARLNDDRGTADVAFHTTEAVFSTAMVIQVVRGALGRGRPYVVDDENGEKRNGDPREFKFLRGFTSYNYRSWPSMHAMANFAVASALSQEMRVRDTPHRQVLAPALYAAAVMPSLARMYLDEHWTSDIAMGAFLGVFAGQKVVSYSHDHRDNRVDRALLGPRMNVGIVHDARGLSLFASPF